MPNRRRHTQWRSVVEEVPRCSRPPEPRPHAFYRLAVCFCGTCQPRFASRATTVLRHCAAGFCARILSFRLWIFRELYSVSRAMAAFVRQWVLERPLAVACCRSVLSFGAGIAFQTSRLAVLWAFKNVRHNWIHAALKTGQSLQSKRPNGCTWPGKDTYFSSLNPIVCVLHCSYSFIVSPNSTSYNSGVSCRFNLATFGIQQRSRQRTRCSPCPRERCRR